MKQECLIPELLTIDHGLLTRCAEVDMSFTYWPLGSPLDRN